MAEELFEGARLGACHASGVDFCGIKAPTEQTRRLCDECPSAVREACLAYGLANEKFGVWGGKGEQERKKMRRAMGIPEPAMRGIEEWIRSERYSTAHTAVKNRKRKEAQRQLKKMLSSQ